jgi:hypothetical protein
MTNSICKAAGFGAALLGFWLASLPAKAEMMLGFSWKGVEGCRGGVVSPSFVVQGAPAGTRTLSFTLEMLAAGKVDMVDSELGGSAVPFPTSGIVPQGAVYARAPCNPGQYRWIVVARDAGGLELATARKANAFPF